MTAREKSVERLASILYTNLYGALRATAVPWESIGREQDVFRREAERVLKACNLVALDPALVAKIEEHPEWLDTGHSEDEENCDHAGICLRCASKLALAEDVIR